VTTVRGAGTLDAYPSITADKLNIFIEEQSDAGDVAIFQAARSNPNAIFSPPTMVSALNTPGYDGQPYVAPDMSELYFTRGATSGGPVSIYSAAWNGLQWGDASLVAGGVNTGAYRSVPVVTADRLTIFFGVRLDDGGGNVDIYQATRPSTSAPFGTAAPVDPLNSGMNDSPDWISTDQCVIYLHSDRSGVLHIYRATR
jgi:Tol biopolymer transport system component